MKWWLVLLFLLPLVAEAQELKRNEMDVQSNKKLVETSPVNVKAAPDSKMDVALRAAGTSFFLQLAGSGTGANTININDLAIFLLDNDSTVTVQSAAIQGYGGDNTIKTYIHEYPLRQEDLESLSRHNVKALRKYSMIGFEDIYLSERDGANLKTLFAFFLKKLGEEHLLKVKAKPVAPAFPGGKEVLLSFLNRNLKALPMLAPGEQKKALVQFQVSADGSIDDIQIKQSASAHYDNELLRILKRMPRWKSALENGKQVNAVVTQEVNFYKEDTKVKVRF